MLRILVLLVWLTASGVDGGPFSWLRSLVFSDPNEMRLHPLSPREGMLSRSKRQAYQVYMGGDVSVTIDKSNKPGTGPWTPYTLDRQCSRTCGGGVKIEKRHCNGECTGPSVRYATCNSAACPDHQGKGLTFREEQCEQHNDSPLNGKYYKWVPYKGKNKCELVCKPKDATFYYVFAPTVVDGTPCDSMANSICVSGKCLPLGCDKKLGSDMKEDKCGVCDGDGSSCTTVQGVFDERGLSVGYHDIIQLPIGATAIRVEEIRPSTNNLAIRNDSGEYYLNGDLQIEVHETEVSAAATIFQYDKRKSNGYSFERLTAKGPLSENLIISLVFQPGNKDSAIEYEFSVPLEDDVPYFYKPDQWSGCSVTCGKGTENREAFCVETKSGNRVADELCDELNMTRPETSRSCETVDCDPVWFEGDWEECSETCGDKGEQYRVVYCHSVNRDGRRLTVDDGNCTGERGPVQRACNRFVCPEWVAGPWSACSEPCGDAFQYRSLTCRSEKEGQEGKVLPAEECGEREEAMNEDRRECNLGPCQGLTFHITQWTPCTKCNDTEETRNVTCQDRDNRAYPMEKCLNETVKEVPATTQPCASQPPCLYEWHTGQWDQCSTQCGHGHQTRRVICAIHQLGDITVVDEGHCGSMKPNDTQQCTNEAECTGTYYTGPWTECSKSCAGGTQTRLVVCLNYDKNAVPDMCDEADKPSLQQDCNVEPCPVCFDSEFGCCPDNSTFAKGVFNEGCSNCSSSEFGCCNDNYTEATGPRSKGCPEAEELEESESEESSGEEIEEETERETAEEEEEEEGEKDELCEVTRADGDTAQIVCAEQALVLQDDNTTMENETLAENVTIDCKDSEFGCCPDWYTVAEGADQAGCPQFIQGECNETKYGCCPDEVTLARGSKFEGCGAPSCAASLYGCCKDRKTIAFGPHYDGCDRSAFPCELTSHGCCPDGETAALGDGGKGCAENCLLTQFGCCPDGVTAAEGEKNEGCGCQYAQYGCCPDGVSAAQGAGFRGCPQTCAQSAQGCCPDGKTPVRGPNNQGCPCQYTQFGCCPDGETTALGSNQEGCDDCRYAKHGCCADGLSKALGPDSAGCPSTTAAPYVLGGTVAPARIASCSLPQHGGTQCGSEYQLRFYYDIDQSRCSQFWYLGCDGNDNNFVTEQECKTVCVHPPGIGRCYLPKVEGAERCHRQAVARYWYDFTLKNCAPFWFRDCDGNDNNFEQYEECLRFCQGVGPPQEQHVQSPIQLPPQPPQPPQPHAADVQPVDVHHHMDVDKRMCGQSADSGPCTTYTDMWYFDSFGGRCHTFIYGGCQGNDNRYATLQDCQARCGHLQPDNSAKKRGVCSLPVDVGRCDGHFDSWYYEVATGSCIQFQYSGCGGNGNRFSSQAQCEQLCLGQSQVAQPFLSQPQTGHIPEHPEFGQLIQPDVGIINEKSRCREEKTTGPCSNFEIKWFYNKEKGTCERFHYGGCQGTANRFDSEMLCKQLCADYTYACDLPKVYGPCTGKQARWYFDRASGQCKTFTYGGCMGNINNFHSKQECLSECAPNKKVVKETDEVVGDVCLLAKDAGPCNASISVYYYDWQNGQCKIFTYGGCLGNANRFETSAKCLSQCAVYQEAKQLPLTRTDNQVDRWTDQSTNLDLNYVEEAAADASTPSTKTYAKPTSFLPELCQLVEDKGQCFGELLRWRFSMELGECVSFMYSGCDGNANRFSSMESCQRACGIYRDQDVCSIDKDVGGCSLALTKWYFNRETDECHTFLYSGCYGNGNRFASKEECLQLCHGEVNVDNICWLPRDSGPCADAVSQWHFDRDTLSCRPFTYGGCRGNENRFDSKLSCQKRCLPPKSQRLTVLDTEAICTQPFDAGPCRKAEKRWYFDASTGRCRSFVYGGCRGNGNRFETQIDCSDTCHSLLNRYALEQRASVMEEGSTYRQGSTVTLHCNARGQSPVHWFLGGQQIPVGSNSHKRIQTREEGRELKVFDARPRDSGFYACAAGPTAILSDPVHILVKGEERKEQCADVGSKDQCSLIVAMAMCANERYSHFCCHSCRNSSDPKI